MSLGEGQLARGGLVVNEFACPCRDRKFALKMPENFKLTRLGAKLLFWKETKSIQDHFSEVTFAL